MNSLKYIIDLEIQKGLWGDLKALLEPYRNIMTIDKICCEDYYNTITSDLDFEVDFKWEYSNQDFKMSPLNDDESLLVNLLIRMHKNWFMHWECQSKELKGVLKYYSGGPLKQDLIRTINKLQLNNSYILKCPQDLYITTIYTYSDMLTIMGLAFWFFPGKKGYTITLKEGTENLKEICLLKSILNTQQLKLFELQGKKVLF